ncbi:hypothetical protein MYX75_08210 [Acidobacteria bacterium AH-259-A15]|nr:hypothetical protein [Acidobacteria bacterium AH-259-A15]
MTEELPSEDFSELRKLYPELTDEELEEVQENLERYVELVLQIYERIELDPEDHAKLRAEIKRSQNQDK